jgi:hypothetical protein
VFKGPFIPTKIFQLGKRIQGQKYFILIVKKSKMKNSKYMRDFLPNFKNAKKIVKKITKFFYNNVSFKTLKSMWK